MATPRTVNTWPLNGVTREFDVTFDYLSRTFVTVSLLGAGVLPLVQGTDYVFVTATRIRTTLAYGTPYTTIEIRRVTSTTERLVEFQDASILHASDLNIDSLQVMHVAEEARESATETIGVNGDGDLDARGRKIVNLGVATARTDAMTLGQYLDDRGGAADSAAAAAASAGQASDSALGVALSASQANAANTSASGHANRSEAAANASEASKNQAGLLAVAAEQSNQAAGVQAGNAQASAQAAAQSATNAGSSASAASTSASGAAASLSTFQNQYWGTYGSDPTTGPGGRNRVPGVFYFNTTSNTHRVWTGTAWTNAPQGPAGTPGTPGAPGKSGAVIRRGWRFAYASATKVRFFPYYSEQVRNKKTLSSSTDWPLIYQDESSASYTEYTLGTGQWANLQNDVLYCVCDYGVNSSNEISVAPVLASVALPTWDPEYGWIRGGAYLSQKAPIYGAFSLTSGQFRDDETARCVVSSVNQPPRSIQNRRSSGLVVAPGTNDVIAASVKIAILGADVYATMNAAVQTATENVGLFFGTWAAQAPGAAQVQLDGAAAADIKGSFWAAGIALQHPFSYGVQNIHTRLSNLGASNLTAMGNSPLGLNWGLKGIICDRQ